MYNKKYSSIISLVLIAIIFQFLPLIGMSQHIIIYPAPKGEVIDQTYTVLVKGKKLAIYKVKVASGDTQQRFKATDDLMNSAKYFDTAAFCYFSTPSAVAVSVQIKESIKSIVVLPLCYHIKPIISAHKIIFSVQPNQNLTIEINGNKINSLHIFSNAVDHFIPKKGQPNVIYFGPGIHEVTSMVIKDNQTVYVAGGAIIRAVIGKNEKYTTEPSGLRNYAPTFILSGRHIKFEGQGIIDGSGCPSHSRNLLSVIHGKDISIKDVILKNPCGWTIPIMQSDSIKITNVKIIGYRANSDGIDICNSRNIIINNCFIRTSDDLIVIKSFENQGKVDHILIENCILWNQLANAMSIGGELREDVSNVLFSNCHIIHDLSRECSLRIFQCDGSKISNIRFENLDIAEANRFISLWIGKAGPSFDNNLGYIQDIIFKNIKVDGLQPGTEIIGADINHKITNVSFINIKLNGQILNKGQMRLNPYTQDIIIQP
ncbi:glycosyl hydrolase family 28 protein [Mucilaginibacter sp.]|uniref:glycosyl hydrolase family 28 protein n=1 Tax=Mucilaginibacter sp. TaxID=1882438 RepID=UPI003D0E1663